jgi:hypothetical protein
VEAQCDITGCFAAKKTLLNCIGENNPTREAVRRKVDSLLNHEYSCGLMSNIKRTGRNNCLVCALLTRASPLQFKRARSDSDEFSHTTGGSSVPHQKDAPSTALKKRRSFSENDTLESQSQTNPNLSIWEEGEEN